MNDAPGPALRRHTLAALVLEAAFFVLVLSAAGEADQAAARLVPALRDLARTLAPLGRLHPWYRLALAIFWHNARPFLALSLLTALAAALLDGRWGQALGRLLLALTALGAALFWLANVGAAGMVVGVVAHARGAPPILAWLTLLPHGLWEIFAFSWAVALPFHLAWLRSGRKSQVLPAVAPLIWPGAAAALAVLALAAVVEATVSPLVLHALLPPAAAYVPPAQATASISTWAPRGSAAT